MAGIIAFPLRYAPNGSLVTVPDGSDKEIDQAIAIGVLTRVGTRPLNPLFGTPDPAFAGFDISDIQATITTFGPAGVSVESLTQEQQGESTVIATIGWTRED